MDHLINEIDEELRHDRLQKMWKNLAKYIISASILIVVATIIAVSWKNYKASQYEEWTAQLIAAQENMAGDSDQQNKAKETFERLVEDSNKHFAAIAALNLWQLPNRQADNKVEFSPVIKDELYGQINESYKVINAPTSPSDDGATIDKENLFNAFVKEQKAIAFIKNNQKDAAKPILEDLAGSATTPANIKRRAGVFIHYLNR